MYFEASQALQPTGSASHPKHRFFGQVSPKVNFDADLRYNIVKINWLWQAMFRSGYDLNVAPAPNFSVPGHTPN
ncbi:MAG: hypothetical protein IPN53_11025 [Comamonadaceae bacterium]|nr:hypothetical protein [Comamonadaceae bacterium]